MSKPDTKKEIIDSIYDAFIIVGITIGYAMIRKKKHLGCR